MTGKKTKYFHVQLFIYFFLSLTACDRNIIYTDFTKIPSEIWTSDNVLSFTPEIDDTASLNNIFITLRTGIDYPFQNIWLFVLTTSPSGKTVTDTLEYMLTDSKGKRTGRGFGNIKETDLKFRQRVYFPEKGTYTIRIRHGMRMENLKGIYDIGLRIEKASSIDK
ncbi:MAG: gliding motility lipoprotein GldH [Bacteroidales bacterium]